MPPRRGGAGSIGKKEHRKASRKNVGVNDPALSSLRIAITKYAPPQIPDDPNCGTPVYAALSKKRHRQKMCALLNSPQSANRQKSTLVSSSEQTRSGHPHPPKPPAGAGPFKRFLYAS
jgi:hypothetical protein